MAPKFLGRYSLLAQTSATVCIHYDSQAAIGRAGSMMYNGKPHHIRQRHNAIRELISSGIITIDYVKSKDNVLDPLTKGLSRKEVERTSKGMGNRYRILSTHYTMAGGGIRLANIGDQQNTTCPTSVVQAHPVTDLGIPVDNIRSHLPPLPQTISTGAKFGDRLDLSSWFQIWLLGGNYQLVFCLKRVVDCKYIGIVLQNGYRRLIFLSEDPIMPVLLKLDDKFGLAADA
ncbi:hypothetical protein CQW23_13015 [Capsicum baccatum]|uniref:Uncharacterized protein n=1 Tax=Capsicum baccatum TaxID=33114 RepID=A0A2G2WU87_CAPBA|nr:hypothetical protein CQW23_13015 [Capsicum baccatum]